MTDYDDDRGGKGTGNGDEKEGSRRRRRKQDGTAANQDEKRTTDRAADSSLGASLPPPRASPFPSNAPATLRQIPFPPTQRRLRTSSVLPAQ